MRLCVCAAAASFALSLAACSRSAPDSGNLPSLLAADRAFAGLSREQGAAAAFRRYLSTDAVELPQGGEPVHGRAAIAAELEALEPGALDWEPAGGEVAADGTLGYTWGRYVLKVSTPEGATRVSRGKYLSVWRRQADGRWLVVADMGNASSTSPDP